jgi:hypothetical protein
VADRNTGSAFRSEECYDFTESSHSRSGDRAGVTKRKILHTLSGKRLAQLAGGLIVGDSCINPGIPGWGVLAAVTACSKLP